MAVCFGVFTVTGKTPMDQVTMIVNTLGSPDEDFISLAHSSRIKDFLQGK